MASPSSDLPPGWEAAVTDDGRVYYVDHINKITTYAKPEAPLPAGWTAKTAPSGDVYYQNNVTMTTQWERPVAPATAPQPGGSQGGKGFLEEGRSMLRGFKEQLRPLKAQIKEGLRAGAEDLQRKIDEGKQASASAPPMGGPSSANTGAGASPEDQQRAIQQEVERHAVAEQWRMAQAQMNAVSAANAQKRTNANLQLATGIHFGPGRLVRVEEKDTSPFGGAGIKF